MVLVGDRDFSLLHRFKQGTLDFGGRTIDFVGEEQVGKDWPFVSSKLVSPLVEDLRTEDIAGQQVDRELNSRKIQINGLGKDGDQQRLCEPRNALQQ